MKRIAPVLVALLLGCGGGEDGAPTAGSPSPSATAAAASASPEQSSPPPASRAEAVAADTTFAKAAALDAAGRARVEALGVLDRVLATEAADPANAWALAHGLLAGGREWRATDGRLAAEVLAADFLETTPVPGFAAQPGFPRTRGELRVEPHTDLLVKSLLEAGWGLDEALPGRVPAVTPRALLAASRLRFRPNVPTEAAGGGGPRFADPNDGPWSLDAWCRGAAAGDATEWTTATGVDVTLDGVAARLFGTLETETYFLRQAQLGGTPVQKRKQGIFAYTCGGAHVFQGVASCVERGYPAGTTARTRLAKSIELYLFRVPIETRTIDSMLGQAPQFRAILYNQDIKFLGHLLEGLGKVERAGLWTPTETERQLLDMAETRLVFHLLQQEKIGTYAPDALARLRSASDKASQNPLEGFQFYLDLVGDAAHARHGLSIQGGLRSLQSSP